MFYRENGQFKTSYAADQQIFGVTQDRVAVMLLLAVAFLVVPLVASDYFFQAILIPLLIMSLGALGLNILVGYCGQISLGTAAFMAVGAYAAYNLQARFDDMPLLLALIGGGVALVVGIIWGSKLGVQYSLSLVALKALPVVILGGLTSLPGAIIGGLIIGVGEKLSEVYIGPMVGGGIETWFAYGLALCFLLVRPQGLFGDKIIDRV